MKVSEKTLAEIVEAGYSWADFEPRREAVENALADPGALEAADFEGMRKIEYLDEKEGRSIVDVESIRDCNLPVSLSSAEKNDMRKVRILSITCSERSRLT